MSENRKYYKLLDLSRLYCAMLIVLIHMGINNNPIIPCLARQGVPFFFLTSGFFLSKKIKHTNSKSNMIKQYVISTISLYCIWFLISFPPIFSEYCKLYPDSKLKLLFVLMRRFLLAGTAPYWYLLVLSEGAIILVFLYYNKKVGCITSMVGLILWNIYNVQSIYNTHGLLYRTFSFLFSWNNNVIMMGFPLLFIGSSLEEYEEALYKCTNKFLLPILYFISILLAFLSFYINPNLPVIIPYALFQAILLFLICITNTSIDSIINTKVCKEARNLSTVIFLTHVLFLALLGKGLHIWNIIILYVCTLFLAALLLQMIMRINSTRLNWLFMIKQ